MLMRPVSAFDERDDGDSNEDQDRDHARDFHPAWRTRVLRLLSHGSNLSRQSVSVNTTCML
jgi:hypothetical protein